MMSTRMRSRPLALLALFLGACLPAAVMAQCPAPPATSPLAEGEIGLFFDPLGTETCGNVAVGGTTLLYVVARVPEGGVARFEIPDLLTGNLPAGMLLLPTGLPPGSLYDALLYADACSQAERRDPSVCPVAPGDLLVIAMVPVMAFLPVNGTVCFQTACPTIAGPVPGAPLYFRCDTGAMHEFTGGDRMCIGIGQPPLSLESATWGAVKLLYRDE